MKFYLVHMVYDPDEYELLNTIQYQYMTFYAETPSHAKEQALDAEPNMRVVTVYECVPVWLGAQPQVIDSCHRAFGSNWCSTHDEPWPTLSQRCGRFPQITDPE